jgi:hypothetical protein
MGEKSNRGFGRTLARISTVALAAAQRMAKADGLPVSVWLHRLVMREDARKEAENDSSGVAIHGDVQGVQETGAGAARAASAQ